MSTPELQKHDNGVYYIHWTEGRRSMRMTTKQTEERPAQVFLANWLLAKNAAPGETASVVMVEDLWALYCKEHKVISETTREQSWKNLKPHFAKLTVSQVNYDTVNGTDRKDGYVQLREKGVIGLPSVCSTIRRELVALTACFSHHANPKRKRLTKAEVPSFDLPRMNDPKDRWLRHPEIQKMLDAAGKMRRGERLSRGERFLWLALETAARKTAIYELTWDRVDFETGVIHYDVPGRIKTKKRRSSPPISKALLPILKRAYEEREGPLVMDNKAEVLAIVKRVAENAGVADVSPHVLRHTAATHMARRGVPLWQIAGVLGNTMAMVEKVYAKHAPDGLVNAVNSISGGKLEAAE